jgi:chemotaxis protein MotB
MRRRRTRIEESQSHDRWMVSYSDFITVLFALFVVLFATSYRDNQAVRKVSRAIHIGFQQLSPLSGGQSNGGVTYSDPLQNVSASSLPLPAAQTPKSDATDASGIDLDELRRQLEAALGQEIQKREVVLRVTPEGFIISLKDLGFFNSGQAVLRSGAEAKIERIAKVLSQHGFDIRVEGHSDNQPIHTPQFRSNWQLSTARAMTVLLLLVNDSKLDPKRVSVAGYGEYRPVADNTTPDGRRMNRRVDLVVVAGAAPQPSIP